MGDARGEPGWSLTVEGSGRVLVHAAVELRLHLSRVTNQPGRTVRLRSGNASGDGFEAIIDGDDVLLIGESDRGALNAAYWLLEQLGFLWVEPGDSGLCFAPAGELPEGHHVHDPSFERRTLILGQDALHDNWQDWLEWASRNRLNDVFFHDTPPSRLSRGDSHPESWEDLAADGGGWLFERWDRDGARIREQAGERGLSVQFGGHHLPSILPRELFSSHPDWFPLRNGQRDGRFNYCGSSESVAYLRRAAEEFVARFPGADIYHIWGDDIRGGGWCECGNGCGSLSPSDQALAASNVVAASVGSVVPGAKVAHLAYHDTVAPPAEVEPVENVQLLWAPRERCYAHSLNAASCERNRRKYWEPFLGLLDRFGGDPSRVSLFEYYSDSILFKGLAPTHLSVLPADMKAYRRAGAANVQNLMVGDRPWVGPPWHAWWFARTAWDASADPNDSLDRFCAAAFPSHAAEMAGYYRSQEGAYSAVLDLHDLEPLPRHDVLDFSDTPRPTLATKAEELRLAEDTLSRAEASLASLLGGDEGERDRLQRERTQAAVVATTSRHLAARVGAWDAAANGQQKEGLRLIEAAEGELAAIAEWDADNSSPGYANLTSGARRAMRYHTRKIRKSLEGLS